MKGLADRGIEGCRKSRDWNVECQSSTRLYTSTEAASARRRVLDQYKDYRGGTDPVGFFTAPGLLGEHAYPNYKIFSVKDAKLRVFSGPSQKSKARMVDVSKGSKFSIDGLWGTDRTTWMYTFLDAKDGLLKVNLVKTIPGGFFESTPKKERTPVWIEDTLADRVYYFDEVVRSIQFMHSPPKVPFYDSPGGQVVEIAPPPKYFAIGIAETMLHDGEFWIKVGYAEGIPCSRAAMPTPKEILGKWFPYRAAAVSFYGPC